MFHFDHWPKGHLTRPIVWGHWVISINIFEPSGENRSISEGWVYFPFHGSSPAIVVSKIAGHDPPVRTQASWVQYGAPRCKNHSFHQSRCRFGGSEHLHFFEKWLGHATGHSGHSILRHQATGPLPSCSSWPTIPWKFRNNIPWIAAGREQPRHGCCEMIQGSQKRSGWRLNRTNICVLMGFDFDYPKISKKNPKAQTPTHFPMYSLYTVAACWFQQYFKHCQPWKWDDDPQMISSLYSGASTTTSRV